MWQRWVRRSSKAVVDTFNGQRGSDTMFCYDGADTFVFSAGNDMVFGGDGIATMIFQDALAEYDIINAGNGYFTVRNTVAAVDFTGIEQLFFADQIFSFLT